MKRLIIAILIIAYAISVGAQNQDDPAKKYEDFKKQAKQTYIDFRANANARYAEFMCLAWKVFSVSPAIPTPQSLEPVAPVVVEPDKKPTADPLPIDKITPFPEVMPRPNPIAPVLPPDLATPETTKSVKQAFSFAFYDTECEVRLDNTLRFSLFSIAEKNVAQAWEFLSSKQYDALLYDCLALRDKLNLCDWGYFQLLKVMSETFFKKTNNEAVLLQMFLLTQSGYKVRIARTDTHLALIVPFYQNIYNYTYINIRGTRYYVINKELKEESLYICDQEFPKEQYFSWQMELPKLDVKLSPPKTFTSSLYSEVSVSIQTNQNLIDFYNDYPLTSAWNLYVNAGLSETVKEMLYPVLQNAIAGKTKVQAATLLLNFCQMAFDYMTCAEQFGYERPFFADENFFFPYNNCKHRATLYALLVKDLLKLEVVLLHYPGHLATAVYFSENIVGDFLTIDGKKFVVCDPTYIGASIGMAMDNCKQEKAQVIRL